MWRGAAERPVGEEEAGTQFCVELIPVITSMLPRPDALTESMSGEARTPAAGRENADQQTPVLTTG